MKRKSMKSHSKDSLISFMLMLGAFVLLINLPMHAPVIGSKEGRIATPKLPKTPESRATTHKDRQEYYFRLLRSPLTNRIPDNIRQKELEFARNLDIQNKSKKKNSILENVTYYEIGPYDVGGRTRGFGIDVRNSNILIAGGASGGIWKSTDGGASWVFKSSPTQTHGISSIVQDPINPDTWYAATAEFFGSARARGGDSHYYGTGIFHSTDNGETWNLLNSTATGPDPFLPDSNDSDVIFNSVFDFVSRLVISPTTGTQFLASNAFGIFRSTDGYVNNELVLGAGNNHIYSDIAVASNGNLIAVLSSAYSGVTVTSNPGIYFSEDDGITWNNITPSDFPSSHERSVVDISDSNPNIAFVLTSTDGTSSGMKLFRLDLTNYPTVVSQNRSANIPDFGGPVGDLDPQGSYNMTIRIHPTNPDFVLIGATNLFRSTDGFSTAPPDDGNGNTDPSVADDYWIGGYANENNVSQFTGHHPDNHQIVFDPNNSNRVFSLHDGGISLTEDITANPISWTTRENGYNVTQFYTVSIHPNAGNSRIAGGTQDNGSPYFNYNTSGANNPYSDISSGDGAYQYLGNTYLLSSSQKGRMLKWNYSFNSLTYVKPTGSANQLFIHPFAVNPSDEDYVAYPETDHIWINDQMSTVSTGTSNFGTSEGWTELTSVNTGGSGHIISSLKFTTANPSNRLYYAGYDMNAPPTFHSTNPTVASPSVNDRSIDIAAQGSYIHGIAVNLENGNEVLAVVSNYEVESVFHTIDGGFNWTAVGGNLESPNGPSVRTAAITKNGDNNTVYFIGTSTGLYATETLDGSNTVWIRQAEDLIGNSVVEFLDYRASDKTLAIATHGRGLFLADVSTAVSNEEEPEELPLSFELAQNYPNPFNPSTQIQYSVPTTSTVSVAVYDVNGRKVTDLLRNERKAAGFYELTFNAGGLASGIYLYRIKAVAENGQGTYTDIRKMTLIK